MEVFMRPVALAVPLALAVVAALSGQPGKKVFISVDMEGISGSPAPTSFRRPARNTTGRGS
jgi:hypothetical protein